MNMSRLVDLSDVSYTEVWMSNVPYDGVMSYMDVPYLIVRIHVWYKVVDVPYDWVML